MLRLYCRRRIKTSTTDASLSKKALGLISYSATLTKGRADQGELYLYLNTLITAFGGAEGKQDNKNASIKEFKQ